MNIGKWMPAPRSFTRLAQQRGHARRLVGIDLNTAMLAVAHGKAAGVEWIEGSALDLPFDASSFDCPRH
jgi:ubiquinone/menaquinone biosynthesis C-methylase UbiE